MSSVPAAELMQLASSLYKKGLTDEEVRSQLREKGAVENLLQDTLTLVKSLRLVKKRKNGFLCCGIGVFLLVIGCMFTLMLFNNGGNIRLVMYGITSIGIAFTLKGMIDLLGW